MSEESLQKYSFRTFSLLELEEIQEAIRVEILKRELKPLQYEVAALRKRVENLSEFVKDNI